MEFKAKFIRPGGYKEGENWRKQEGIFETSDKYPKTIAVSFFNELVDKLADLKQGIDYILCVDIESREWNGKWYTDVKAWRVALPGESKEDTTSAPVQQQQQQNEKDDLPF